MPPFPFRKSAIRNRSDFGERGTGLRCLLKVSIGLGALLIAAAGSACGGSSGGSGGKPLKGAGSSLVYPLVSAWTPPLGDHGLDLSYNPIGSGGGVQAITTRTVDFGASDAPLTSDQAKACESCVQVPWALSATTLSYDAKTLGRGLRLTGPVIADIYLGKITNWSDPRIASLNPGKKLPSQGIGAIFRSEASGDTYALTSYLSKISPEWKREVGTGTTVNFPVGAGGKGNSGVAGTLTRNPGRDRLHQRRLCRPEQARSRFDPERGRDLRPPRCEGDRGSRGRDGQAGTGQLDLDRRPARLCDGRLSDLDVLLRDRAQELREST